MPNLQGALKAFEAGVDGLVVEGTEGGGFKGYEEIGLTVLIQAIKNEIDLEKFRNLESNKFYIEDYIDVDKEISIAGCLGINNQFRYYDPVNNLHKNNILSKTVFPDDKLNNSIKN